MSRMNEPMATGPTGGEQVSTPSGGTGQNIREMGEQVRQAAREQMENIRDTASQYYEQGRVKAQEWQENLEGYVQDQPMKSLLIAAGVGFLLGVIWKRS